MGAKIQTGPGVRIETRPGGGIETHARPPPLDATAALNRYSSQLELGHDAGRKLDAGLAQLREAHRRAGGATQGTEHQRLLLVVQTDLLDGRTTVCPGLCNLGLGEH